MNTEKAIDLLDNLVLMMFEDDYESDYDTALRMAIDALKTQADSDTVSRQAVYDTLTEYYHHSTDIQHKALAEALSRVPSTSRPQVIHCKDYRWRNDVGHWLGCPILNSDDDNYCSFAERK